MDLDFIFSTTANGVRVGHSSRPAAQNGHGAYQLLGLPQEHGIEVLKLKHRWLAFASLAVN